VPLLLPLIPVLVELSKLVSEKVADCVAGRVGDKQTDKEILEALLSKPAIDALFNILASTPVANTPDKIAGIRGLIVEGSGALKSLQAGQPLNVSALTEAIVTAFQPFLVEGKEYLINQLTEKAAQAQEKAAQAQKKVEKESADA